MAAIVSYLHPHMETRINDNSAIVDYQTSAGTVTFIPYFSDRGIDGEIELYTSYTQFINDKGTPNFKRHGQSIYNVLQFLRGGGSVYAMRLLPSDAIRANVALTAKVQDKAVAAAGEGVVDDQLKDDLQTLLDEGLKGYTPVEGTDGEQVGVEGQFVQFMSRGRGVYGNKYTVDLLYNAELTKSYEFAIYELTVKENGKTIEGPYYVSLQPEAVNVAGKSMYIRNVIEEYSESIVARVNEALYDELVMALEGGKITVNKYDAESKKYVNVEVDINVYEADLLGLPNSGISLDLSGGTDGNIKEDEDGEGSEDSKNGLLIGAFSDHRLQSKTRFPLDILLDANYDSVVKRAIHTLAKTRGDVFTVLDLGPNKVSRPEFAIQIKDSLADISDDRTVAFYAQSFTVYDSFTNSDILVTMPYFLAYKIPANDRQYGMHYAVAGPKRGVISGFKSMSFNPTVDEKENLYKARVNYAEQDYRATKLMSQLTSQVATSALSNINNMRVLLRMIRDVEEISGNYFFEFASSSTLSHFEAAINSYLSEWVNNGACQVCQGVVYQNDYDVVQRIVRVSIELVFTGLIERIVIEFNVGTNAA